VPKSYLEDIWRYKAVDTISWRVEISHGKFVFEEVLEIGQ
jgi:hypothetical protein